MPWLSISNLAHNIVRTSTLHCIGVVDVYVRLSEGPAYGTVDIFWSSFYRVHFIDSVLFIVFY